MTNIHLDTSHKFIIFSFVILFTSVSLKSCANATISLNIYKLSSRVYMYSREDENQRLLVICSFSEKETKLNIPSNFDLSKSTLILNNYNNDSLVLKPYETRVYLWNK